MVTIQRPVPPPLRLAVAVVLGLMIAPVTSHASTVFYTDQAAFGTAAPGATAVSFSGLTGVRANGFMSSGVTFSTLTPFSASQALIGGGGKLGNNYFGNTLVLSFGSDGGGH
jgi:hypothetical protein